MAAKKGRRALVCDCIPLERADSVEALAGVAGPGRWLIFRYEPTALFSLKASSATSSAGKTLLVPTPYATKMAFVDAAFRMGWTGDVAQLVTELAHADLRIGVPRQAVVTHTIVKVRQEPKARRPGRPYIPAVAYREYVYFLGELRFALDVTTIIESAAHALVEIGPSVQYIGKRGGFLQFRGLERAGTLTLDFTQPIDNAALIVPGGLHIAMLDDFGPEANLDALNSYNTKPIKRGIHRKFVRTAVPLALTNVGPGFSEYMATGIDQEE